MTEHIESSTIAPDDYDANTENGYSSTPNLYTLSSTSDTETFLTRFTRENGYKDSTTGTTLKLGDQIKIQDGTYNVNWYVAGFDVEKTRTATDGTLYDNGYGIALIPVTTLTSSVYDIIGSWLNATESGNYFDSKLYPTVVTNLQTVLGNHLTTRSVLLFSSTNALSTADNYYRYPTGYTWYSDKYVTSLSAKQVLSNPTISETSSDISMDNDIISYYDIGEANYKLPLFDNIGCYNNYFWYIRSMRTYTNYDKDDGYEQYYKCASPNSTSDGYTYASYRRASSSVTHYTYCRPLIYIR